MEEDDQRKRVLRSKSIFAHSDGEVDYDFTNTRDIASHIKQRYTTNSDNASYFYAKNKKVNFLERLQSGKNPSCSLKDKTKLILGSRDNKFKGMNKQRTTEGSAMQQKSSKTLLENVSIVKPMESKLLHVLSVEATAEADRISKRNTENNTEKLKNINRKLNKYIENSESRKEVLDFLVEIAEKELKKIVSAEKLCRNIKTQKIDSKRGIRSNTPQKDSEYGAAKTYSSNKQATLKARDLSLDSSEIFFETVQKNGIFMYICPEADCKKMFPSLSRIKRHYIIHTGVKPFKCVSPRCPKRFSRKDNMLQHHKTHCKFS